MVLAATAHTAWVRRAAAHPLIAAACEGHHVKHKANGGPTSLKGCVLLCSYHHQIVIHRWAGPWS
jgi:hypothetical protein